MTDEPSDLAARLTHAAVMNRLFGAPQQEVRIDRYLLKRRIGRGGMGEVFSAFDTELQRTVALKFLFPGEHDNERARLIREAQAIAKIESPNVVQAYEVTEYEGRTVLAMQYVQGQSLRAWQRASGRSWRDIVEAYRKAGTGLAAAHAAGVTHGDFKPSNVLIGDDGGVRVVDFGLARTVSTLFQDISLGGSSTIQSGSGATDTVRGTIGYMAPEQGLKRETNTLSDQFSFCAALWEALSGSKPFGNTKLEPEATMPVLGRLGRAPRDIRRALVRGLSIDPTKRWPAMEPLLVALSRDGIRKKRTVLGLTGAIAGAVAVGVYVGAKDDPCGTPPRYVAEAWGQATRDALASTATDYPPATTSWKTALAGLDADHASIVSAWKEICAARSSPKVAPLARVDAERCVHSRANELALVAATMAEQTGNAMFEANELRDRVMGSSNDCVQYLAASYPGQRTEGVEPDPKLSSIAAAAQASLVLGRLDDAEAHLERLDDAVASQQKPGVIGAHAELLHAELLRSQGSFVDARKRGLMALRLATETGALDTEVAAGRFVVELSTEDLSDQRSAESLLYPYQGASERLATREPIAQIDYLNTAGLVALNGDDPGAAVKLHREALERSQSVNDDPYFTRKLASWTRLATALTDRSKNTDKREPKWDDDDLEWAANAYAAALVEATELLGPIHPRVSFLHLNLGINALKREQFQQAHDHLMRADGGFTTVFGRESLQVARTSIFLSDALAQLGRVDEAYDSAQHAWDHYRSVTPRDNEERLNALRALQQAQDQLGLDVEQLQTNAILLRDLPEDSMERPALNHTNAWILCHEQHRCEQARPFIDAAREGFAPGDLWWLYFVNTRAQVEYGEGNHEAAFASLTTVLDQAKEYGDDALNEEACAVGASWGARGRELVASKEVCAPTQP